MSQTVSTAADLRPGLIRTLVPFIVGPIGAWLAVHLGLPVDDVTNPTGPLFVLVNGALSAAFGYIYYVVARFLEVGVSPKWGYILGSRKQPVYTEPPAVVTEHGRQHLVGDPPRAGKKRAAKKSAGAGELRLIVCVAGGIVVACIVLALLRAALH